MESNFSQWVNNQNTTARLAQIVTQGNHTVKLLPPARGSLFVDLLAWNLKQKIEILLRTKMNSFLLTQCVCYATVTDYRLHTLSFLHL
jgi:hypothetical protein